MRVNVILACLAAILLIAIAVVATTANAATCLAWHDLQAQLATRYGEQPVFVGRGTEPDRELAVLAAPQGTWSLIARQPDGSACLLASGTTWAALDPALTPPLPGTEN